VHANISAVKRAAAAAIAQGAVGHVGSFAAGPTAAGTEHIHKYFGKRFSAFCCEHAEWLLDHWAANLREKPPAPVDARLVLVALVVANMDLERAEQVISSRVPVSPSRPQVVLLRPEGVRDAYLMQERVVLVRLLSHREACESLPNLHEHEQDTALMREMCEHPDPSTLEVVWGHFEHSEPAVPVATRIGLMKRVTGSAEHVPVAKTTVLRLPDQ
jgi:hypothetical protein